MENPQHMMHAGRVHRFGGPEVITFEETAVPEPRGGEIRVRVAAAGVGPWDAWVRSGHSALQQTLPLTLGSDIAGVIDALGPDVSGRVVGERVFGVTNRQFTGGYAEFAIASARSVARLPDGVDFVRGASVPVVAVTAAQMLSTAGVGRGSRVLIHGAAGSVGGFALQLAHAAGAITVASVQAADSTEIVADRVIQADAQAAGELKGTLDAVLDLVGGSSQPRLFDFLKPGGVLVSAVSAPDSGLAQAHNVRAAFFLVDVTTSVWNAARSEHRAASN